MIMTKEMNICPVTYFKLIPFQPIRYNRFISKSLLPRQMGFKNEQYFKITHAIDNFEGFRFKSSGCLLNGK